MRVVGLTGGIGSGKSLVAARFADLGVPVIDTDLIARELVMPGTPALARIAERFGEAILQADGSLDRGALGRRVFDDPQARHWLEQLLHPLIRDTVSERIAGIDAPYCLVVIPLLVETGRWAVLDRVLVVDVPEQTQLRRTMARDGLDEARVRAILAAQCSRDARLSAADDVIVNDGDPADLDPVIARLDARYRDNTE